MIQTLNTDSAAMAQKDPKDPITFGERLTGTLLFMPVLLTRFLPYRWRVPLAGWLASQVLAPLAGYRKRIRDNLAHACPDLPKEEVERLVRRVANNVGRNMIELYSPEFVEHVRPSKCFGPGIEILQKARDEGRPCVLMSAHLGNFNAARIGIIENGITSTGYFYRNMSNRPFNAHYVEAMASVSQPIFEQSRKGMVQMIKHLKTGGFLGILGDLNAHDGLPLEFFGKPALTSISGAEMALKYNAPMVPIWGRRLENGMDFEIVFEDEIPPSDPLTMTREFNARLEAMVRANMDQWFWIHRRWKDGANWVGEMRAKELAELEAKIAAAKA
ncbi:MAG: lysophospholipid acyltransferase family protein [Pseudomonadota bacterium]